MISSLRNFAKTKIAGIFVFIIIIPFVFWGMGSVFNSGNTNNIAKINNINISTNDFMDYLNESGLSSDVIKENLDNNILEELLSALVSKTLIDLEIKDLKISITEETLIKKLKQSKNFLDENKVFQRTLYEKFLLLNNTNAPIFETRLKNNELQKQLFAYIGGGIQSPEFLINRNYREDNKKLDIDYINLNNFYKKKDEFNSKDLKIFVDQNSDNLKQDYIDLSYININPKNLLGLEDYNQIFFDKIDEIENQISNNIDFSAIITDLNIKPIIIKNYVKLDNKDNIENKIYNKRNNKTELLEDQGTYILYNIDKIVTKLPSLNDKNFNKKIINLLYQNEKFEYNKKILDEIKDNKFNQTSFDKLGVNLIQKTQFKSINDNDKFEKNSLEILYSLPINAYTLIADNEKNIYIAKIIKYQEENIGKNSKEFIKSTLDTNAKNRNNVLRSYDFFLNEKYEVTVNQKTLDRVKNYFR